MKKRHWLITAILVPVLACAGTTSTPLMNLQLPVPGTQSGPLWAQNLNDAFGLVDSHDHTPGKGSLVPVAGLNINDDLPMANHNLSLPRSVRYTNQSATLSTSNDKNEVYVVNGDLYYNNSAGTSIQLTSGSGLNAASIGGIGGDYASSTAAETYTSATKTFNFTQSSGVTAKLSCGDLSISENVASSLPITIKSPASLGASYSLTLPTSLPASKKIMTVTSAGVMAADYTVDNSTIEVSSNTIRVKDGGITNAKLATAIQASLIPPGSILPYAGTSAPAGYLLADGSAVSRTTYADLFSAIGTAHGSGDGSTTFNLPDYRGRFLRGVDSAVGRDPDRASRTAMASGGNTGDAVGSVQGDAFASHNHTLTDPGHTHTILGASGAQTSNTGRGSSFTTNNTNYNVTSSSSTTGITIAATGTSTETRPTNAGVNFIIKY